MNTNQPGLTAAQIAALKDMYLLPIAAHSVAPWDWRNYKLCSTQRGRVIAEINELSMECDGEDRANQRLIRAAPELLSACIVALLAIHSHPHNYNDPKLCDAADSLRAAVSRAVVGPVAGGKP